MLEPDFVALIANAGRTFMFELIRLSLSCSQEAGPTDAQKHLVHEPQSERIPRPARGG